MDSKAQSPEDDGSDAFGVWSFPCDDPAIAVWIKQHCKPVSFDQLPPRLQASLIAEEARDAAAHASALLEH